MYVRLLTPDTLHKKRSRTGPGLYELPRNRSLRSSVCLIAPVRRVSSGTTPMNDWRGLRVAPRPPPPPPHDRPTARRRPKTAKSRSLSDRVRAAWDTETRVGAGFYSEARNPRAGRVARRPVWGLGFRNCPIRGFFGKSGGPARRKGVKGKDIGGSGPTIRFARLLPRSELLRKQCMEHRASPSSPLLCAQPAPRYTRDHKAKAALRGG
jgi:hypothetical protein